MTNKNSFFLILITLFYISSNIQIFAQVPYQATSIVEGNYNEERTIKIEVTNDDTFHYSVTKNLPPYFSVPVIDVLPNGNLLCIHSLEGIIEIYDLSGNINLQHNFYELAPYNEQKLFYNVNEGGATFLISENNINKIYNLDNSGGIAFEMEIPTGIVEAFSTSADAKLFAYSIINWINDKISIQAEIIALDNEENFKLSSGFTSGKFSEHNELFIGINKRTIFCNDLSNNREVWKKEISEEELILDAQFEGQDVIFVKSENPVFEESTWQYKNSIIIEKKLNGDEFKIKLISENLNEIKLITADNKISLKTEKGVIQIR